MISWGQIHSDFNKMRPSADFSETKCPSSHKWLENKYCPICNAIHDMVLIDAQGLNEEKILSMEKIVAEDPKSPYAEKARKYIAANKDAKLEKLIYCPYHSKDSTGYDECLYRMLCEDYRQVLEYTGPDAEIYKNKVNRHYVLLERNRIAREFVDNYNKMLHGLYFEISKLQEKMPRIQEMASFIEQRKEKVREILEADLAQRYPDRYQERGSAPVFDKSWQEFARSFWDENPFSHRSGLFPWSR